MPSNPTSPTARLTRAAVLFCLILGQLLTTAWVSTPQTLAALSRHSCSSNKPLASVEYAQAAIDFIVISTTVTAAATVTIEPISKSNLATGEPVDTSGVSRRSSFVAHSHRTNRTDTPVRGYALETSNPFNSRSDKPSFGLFQSHPTDTYRLNMPLASVEYAQAAIKFIVTAHVNQHVYPAFKLSLPLL